MPYLISILGFLMFLLFLILVYSYLTAEELTVKKRVEKALRYGIQNKATDNIAQRLASPPEANFWHDKIQDLNSHFEMTSLAKKIEPKLVQAGLTLRGSEFIVISFGVMLFLMLLFMMLSGGNIFIGSIGLIIGYFIPYIFLNRSISIRQKKFNNQIADALVLIASSLRSGYSFMQAIELVGREMQPPISIEFYRVLREINLGVTTDDAMNRMAKRINSDDLDLVVTAVLIQRQIGGNLAEILDNIASTIRDRVKIKGHIKTLTAQGRMSGIIVGLLPIAICIILYLIRPSFISALFMEPIGRMMLFFGVVCEIVGMLVIRNIVNIKV